jgi:hypothetical protein
MVLYIPTTLTKSSKAPVFMWSVGFLQIRRVITALTYRKIRIHGGSFVSGSATGAGLDGSKLAIATNSIVAVVQYRLGAVSLPDFCDMRLANTPC